MAAQRTLKVVIPRRGNMLLPFLREITFEQGIKMVDRRDGFNRPWRIPQVSPSQSAISVADLLTLFAII